MPRLEYMYRGVENFIARDDAGELWLYYRYVDRGPLKFPDNQLDWIDGQVGLCSPPSAGMIPGMRS